jgi:NHL repeat-containing protein
MTAIILAQSAKDFGGAATQGRFNEPYGIAVDRAHNLCVADRHNHCVRRVDGASGVITTLVGNGSAGGQRRWWARGGSGNGRAERLGPRPHGAAVVRCRYRRSPRARRRSRHRRDLSFAGTGEAPHSGDGGPARAAVFDAPKEFALDPDGDILIVNTESHAIRRIDAAIGIVETIAGGHKGSEGDGGPATAAGLGRPHGAVVGPDGAIYIGIPRTIASASSRENTDPLGVYTSAAAVKGSGRRLCTADAEGGRPL